FMNRTLTRDLSEIIGQPIDDYIASASREAVIACVERAFAHGERQSLSYEVFASDGSALNVKTEVVPLGGSSNEQVALLFTTDETERLRLSAELQRSEDFRRQVLEHLPDIVSLLDREHRFV